VHLVVPIILIHYDARSTYSIIMLIWLKVYGGLGFFLHVSDAQ
jgi:hypothetical protein